MTNPYDGIIANIFIGGEYAANKFGNQFELLVNCASGLACPSNHKNCIHLPVHQNEKFAKFYFDMIIETGVLEKIHNCVLENKPVLIYCLQGMHRSCTLGACYIMKYHNLTVEQVMKFMKTKRCIAFNPVYNLIETMHLFYKSLHPHGHTSLEVFSLPNPTIPYIVEEPAPQQPVHKPEPRKEEKIVEPKKEEKIKVIVATPAPKTPKLVEKNVHNNNNKQKDNKQKDNPGKIKNHK